MSDAGEHDTQLAVFHYGWLDWFRKKLPSPVIASPNRALWRVLIHGHGFRAAFPDQSFAVGLYVTVFVPAQTRAEAQDKAVRTVEKFWRSVMPGRHAVGAAVFEAQEPQEDERRFRWRSRSGFIYYSQP